MWITTTSSLIKFQNIKIQIPTFQLEFGFFLFNCVSTLCQSLKLLQRCNLEFGIKKIENLIEYEIGTRNF